MMSVSPRAGIVTGARGTGKTTLCEAVAALSPRFGGIACPAVIDATGGKIGFTCRIIGGPEFELGVSDGGREGERIGRYVLSTEGINRAINGIGESLDTGLVTIIDEIGPLEIKLGGGFAPVLSRLKHDGDLLLVVRGDLIDDVLRLVPGHRVKIFDLDAGKIEADDVLDFYEPATG